MVDVAKIAEGLTEAQRVALKNGLKCRWATIEALRNRRLVSIRTCFPDGNGLPLTPTGLAVREYLKERGT